MSTKPVLDTETALRLLEQVVEEAGPDYTYEYTDEEIAAGIDGYDVFRHEEVTCQYTDGKGAPRCIVGKVLAKWDPENWTDLEVVNNNGPADALGSYGNAERTAAKALRAAQEAQDTGDTWGRALEQAKATAEYIRSVSA